MVWKEKKIDMKSDEDEGVGKSTQRNSGRQVNWEHLAQYQC